MQYKSSKVLKSKTLKMNLSRRFIKVVSTAALPSIPLSGKWLNECGFEVDHSVQLLCSNKCIILTACEENDPEEFSLFGISPLSNDAGPLIQSQRFESFSWLTTQSYNNIELENFLAKKGNFFIFETNVLDLIHILLRSGNLIEK